MTTMNRGQLTTLAAGESSAQLEKDTPAWRIARANEIFARVWPEENNSTLYDVADSTRVDLLDAASDLSGALDDDEPSLRSVVKFWVAHMRELAGHLESAIETQDVLDRAAS